MWEGVGQEKGKGLPRGWVSLISVSQRRKGQRRLHGSYRQLPFRASLTIFLAPSPYTQLIALEELAVI